MDNKLITSREAAIILGYTRASTAGNTLKRYLGKPAGYTASKQYLWNTADVIRISRKLKQLRQDKPGFIPKKEQKERTQPLKNRERVCEKCGKVHKSPYNICPICRKQKHEDPHDIMIKPKKQSRRCPRCGRQNLWEGQYVCSDCKTRYEHWEDPFPGFTV